MSPNASMNPCNLLGSGVGVAVIKTEPAAAIVSAEAVASFVRHPDSISG